MRFVNTAELKNHLNSVLARVSHGEAVIVTIHGKPAATLLPTSEDNLDQIVFERSRVVRQAVQEGLSDLESGRHATLKKYVLRRFGGKSDHVRKGC